MAEEKDTTFTGIVQEGHNPQVSKYGHQPPADIIKGHQPQAAADSAPAKTPPTGWTGAVSSGENEKTDKK